MAVKNGEAFVREQILSILPQLAGDDELIISDDHSTDNTLEILNQLCDRRIRIIQNPSSGLISNFENALRSAQGTYIFLADQDDIWMSEKVETTLQFLKRYDLVVSDCIVVNENLELRHESFYSTNGSRKGILRNLMHNSYMGCCMAFHRKILSKALPFPKEIPMHDLWLGLIAETCFTVKFLEKPLIYHRRHLHNASTTSHPSKASLTRKVGKRIWLLKKIIELSYAA